MPCSNTFDVLARIDGADSEDVGRCVFVVEVFRGGGVERRGIGRDLDVSGIEPEPTAISWSRVNGDTVVIARAFRHRNGTRRLNQKPYARLNHSGWSLAARS